jgi:hypothetical protein
VWLVICWDGPGKGRDQRMGINTRLFDHALMAAVPVKVLDGDKTWRALGAYVKPEMWISPPREEARGLQPGDRASPSRWGRRPRPTPAR